MHHSIIVPYLRLVAYLLYHVGGCTSLSGFVGIWTTTVQQGETMTISSVCCLCNILFINDKMGLPLVKVVIMKQCMW